MDKPKSTPINSITHSSDIFHMIREISAVDVARRFGVYFQRKGKHWVAPCPFHEDRDPSFFEHRNRFKCFGCGWSGDSVDLVAELLRLRPFEAAREIAGAFGLAVENIFSFRGDALLKHRQDRQEAAQQKAREKAEGERLVSDFQTLFRAAERVLAGIRTPDDLERDGWLYRYMTELEEIAINLFSPDPEVRRDAREAARRWLS